MPSRSSGLSSAITARTRHPSRQRHGDRRRATRRAVTRQRCRPAPRPGGPARPGPCRRRRPGAAAAVVGRPSSRSTAVLVRRSVPDPAGAGVPGHVGEQLGDGEVERAGGRVAAAARTAPRSRRPGTALRAARVDSAVGRPSSSAGGCMPRTMSRSSASASRHRARASATSVRRLRVVRRGRSIRDSATPERDQPGLGAVVQVPLDPPQHGRGVGGQRGPAGLQRRDPGLVGGRLQQRPDQQRGPADEQPHEPREHQQQRRALHARAARRRPRCPRPAAEAVGDHAPPRPGDVTRPRPDDQEHAEVGGQRRHQRQPGEAVDQGPPAGAVAQHRAQRTGPARRRAHAAAGTASPSRGAAGPARGSTAAVEPGQDQHADQERQADGQQRQRRRAPARAARARTPARPAAGR